MPGVGGGAWEPKAKGEKTRSLFSERSQYGGGVTQRKTRDHASSWCRGRVSARCSRSRAPGTVRLSTRLCLPWCLSPHGRTMAAAAPDITSGVKTGKRRGKGPVPGSGLHMATPSWKVARQKKGYGQSLGITCLSLRNGWEVTRWPQQVRALWAEGTRCAETQRQTTPQPTSGAPSSSA